MNLDTQTDIELELLFEERTEDPCEHSGHAVRLDAHEGAGEWLVRVVVDCCEKESHDILVCDKFLKTVILSSKRVHCSRCRVRIKAAERYIILGHKGVDF